MTSDHRSHSDLEKLEARGHPLPSTDSNGAGGRTLPNPELKHPLPRRISDALQVPGTVNLSDPSHPYNWASWQKWAIVIVYCTLQMFVTLTSTTYVSVEFLIQERFGGTTQVITLGQSMFIVGTAVGPAFLGKYLVLPVSTSNAATVEKREYA